VCPPTALTAALAATVPLRQLSAWVPGPRPAALLNAAGLGLHRWLEVLARVAIHRPRRACICIGYVSSRTLGSIRNSTSRQAALALSVVACAAAATAARQHTQLDRHHNRGHDHGNSAHLKASYRSIVNPIPMSSVDYVYVIENADDMDVRTISEFRSRASERGPAVEARLAQTATTQVRRQFTRARGRSTRKTAAYHAADAYHCGRGAYRGSAGDEAQTAVGRGAMGGFSSQRGAVADTSSASLAQGGCRKVRWEGGGSKVALKYQPGDS